MLSTSTLESLLIKEALPIIHSRLGDEFQALYLFGSQVSGQTHAESDIDLAVLAKTPIEPLRRWDMQNLLASVLKVEVDLVDLRSASTVMQSQILDGGKLLWAIQPDTGFFEMMVYSEKCKLDEARAPLFEEFRQRGRVYGQ